MTICGRLRSSEGSINTHLSFRSKILSVVPRMLPVNSFPQELEREWAMMSGKFWLRKTTWGVSVRTLLADAIPAGEIIEIPVASCNRTVDVLWEGRRITMFSEDLEVRCRIYCGEMTQNSERTRNVA